VTFREAQGLPGGADSLGVTTLRTHVLGITLGTCSACGETASLRLVETRRQRRWLRRLDPHFDDAALRTATCPRCACTYPVRITDRTALAAGRRVLSAVGRPCGTGRDWAYPAAA
jgi:hypothetical protein